MVWTTLQEIGMDTSQFSGHSFHIGAVAAQAGRPEFLHQTLRQWKSEAFCSRLGHPPTPYSASFRTLLQHQVTVNHQQQCTHCSLSLHICYICCSFQREGPGYNQALMAPTDVVRVVGTSSIWLERRRYLMSMNGLIRLTSWDGSV